MDHNGTYHKCTSIRAPVGNIRNIGCSQFAIFQALENDILSKIHSVGKRLIGGQKA